ncbi:glycosyltransferase [Pedobacter sp. 22226]|uniref:glycosyltransferase n=1 Tax=Pedobacter sp. 22226 TaxID=3453894 RepID=UPI003F832115
MNSRIIIYFRKKPLEDRWFYGDRFLRMLFKSLFKKEKIGGVEKVFLNLRRSFDQLKVNYQINIPFKQIKPKDQLIVLGAGRYALKGYQKTNKIVAGIALMTHPSEWPTLCDDYPIAKYLQHSNWAKNVYVPYYGNHICDTWFVGIDTDAWLPSLKPKSYDILIYNKIRWEHDHYNEVLRNPIINFLNEKNISYKEIVYGDYQEQDYKALLEECKCMVFLCEHESQGFACCEAMSMDVPIYAWDQGFCLDPNRFSWNDPLIPATSAPFFSEECGSTFENFESFTGKFDLFFQGVVQQKFQPRKYIVNNLSLEKSGIRMLEILEEVYK